MRESIDIMAFVFPFDLAFPISSILTEVINCILVVFAVILADYVISHGIELKRILILSVVGYFFAPIFGFLLIPYLPLYVPYYFVYLLPLIFWAIAGEIILQDYDRKNRIMIAILGYIIFLAMVFLNVNTMLIMLIRM